MLTDRTEQTGVSASVPGGEMPPAHTICRSCGYNLHGLQAGDRCPECGVAVSTSLEPISLLENSESNWLWRIWLGLTLSVIVYISLRASSILVVWSGFVAGFWPSPLIILGLFGPLVLLIVTIWMFCAREPYSQSREPLFCFRRLTLIILAVSILHEILLTVMVFSITTARSSQFLLWYPIDFLYHILFAGYGYCFLAYTAMLTVRVPAPQTANWIHRLKWLFPLIVGLSLLDKMLVGSLASGMSLSIRKILNALDGVLTVGVFWILPSLKLAVSIVFIILCYRVIRRQRKRVTNP